LERISLDKLSDLCELVNLVTDISSPKRGVRPAFSEYHIIKAIEILESEGPVGRIILSRLLKLGEASTRSLIKRLKEHELIKIDEIGGAYLTQKGLELLNIWKSNIKQIGEIDLEIPDWSNNFCGIITKGLELIETYGVLRIRDIAVRRGALGLIAIVVKDLKFLLPISKNTFEEVRGELSNICQSLKNFVDNGDAIFIVGANNRIQAKKIFIETLIDILSLYCFIH